MKGTNFTYIFSRYLPHSYFSNSLPFPYSAILFGHDCQTTWQNMKMDAEQFRNVQNLKGTIYASPVQKYFIEFKKSKYRRYLSKIVYAYADPERWVV